MATQVTAESLDTWLYEQPDNTVDTPYEIEVTGLTTSNYGVLRYALGSNPTKYVDFSATSIPSGVIDLQEEFATFNNLIGSPQIPEGVEIMYRTFYGCTNLKHPPVLPSTLSVTSPSLGETFYNCQSLQEMPVIPSSGLDSFSWTFYNCKSLTSVPQLPSNIDSIGNAFVSCTGLVNVAPFSDSLTYFYNAFAYCTSLESPPPFPDTTRNVKQCYRYCTNLKYKPIIPSGALNNSENCYEGVTTTLWCGTLEQVNDWIPNQTNEFEVLIHGTQRIIYGVDISNLDTWLASKDANTADTPYEVRVLGLTSSNIGNIKSALWNNSTKYVDLRYTELPSVTSLSEKFMLCSSLVYAPGIPSTVTSLYSAFYNCRSLKEAPTIPSGVTDMYNAFNTCKALTVVPAIPSGVTDLRFAFGSCENLTAIPTIPNGVTDLSYTFAGCTSIQTITIPSGVTNLTCTFRGCTGLSQVPEIPSSVTTLTSTFENCSGITEVAKIPSSVTSAKEAFKGCTSLTKIDEFQVPLNTLKNNTNFQDMFKNCTSLVSIGFVINEAEDWHVWRLKFGAAAVEGKVIDRNKTVHPITQTSISKSDLQLPILTDELWFPSSSMSDSDIDDVIEDMLDYHYGIFNKPVISPNESNLVLWADDKDRFVTNIKMGGGTDIEVYDTEAEMVADLPNLDPLDIVAYKTSKDPKSGVPLGTWASFENDSAPNGEWIESGTTFDANTYPALAMMLGGNTVPQRFDKNRPSEALLYQGSNGTLATGYERKSLTAGITLDYDAFVTYTGDQTVSTVTFPDGRTKQFTFPASWHSSDTSSQGFFFEKGTNIVFGSENSFVNITYYKHPLFIKATPTSSDSDYEGTLNAIRQYVSNSNSYSTEEVWRGGYWIDGKKIYKKTFTNSWGSSGGVDAVNIDITNLSLDSIVNGEGIMQGNSNIFTKGYAPMTYISSTSSGTANGYFWNINEAKTTLTFRCQGNGLSTKMYECVFTLEYTKTTD